MEKIINILIADDHPLVREALRNNFAKQEDFNIVAEASDGETAVKLAKELPVNVVIMDITMPKMDGFEATRRIKAENSEIGVLVLTVHDNEEFMLKMLQTGADGYLTKDALGSELISAVRTLAAGDMVLSPTILRKIIAYSDHRLLENPKLLKSEFHYLTARELEILRLVAQGYTNKEIALKLDLNLRTIKGHLFTLFTRLNARSRTEAIVIGLRNGILTIDDIIK